MPPPRDSASLFHDSPTETPATWVTAHCDGGARGNPGPAGYGAQVTDASGHVLAELSEYLGHRTNNFAEYSGLLGCLQWALDHNVHQLRVISDSELMVKQIQGKYKVNSPDLRPLWEEARRRIAQLGRFEIAHALRHKNKEADRLANEAMDRGTNRSRPTSNPSPRPEPGSPGLIPGRPSPGAPGPDARTRVSNTPQAPSKPTMLRGFTRNGTIHLLGGATLPDGVFVKVLPED